MDNNAVMVDLETMSTAPNAAIVAIGAVQFDPFGSDTEDSIRADPSRLFYTVISFESNEAEERHFSVSTIKWWLGQSKEAQTALLNPNTHLRGALTEFRMWVDALRPSVDRVWAKSPEFDCVILKNAYDAVGQVWPFQYWNSRDVRTVVELAYPEGDEPRIGGGIAHNALDDTIRQALAVQDAYRTIHKIRSTP
jgi:hypothetical protein